MDFLDIHKTFFETKIGAFSEVTERENYDSQITVTKEEKKIILDYFGAHNIHKGNKTSDPEKAAKEFFLYPDFTPITLNLVFPKPDKTELRLYLSSDHGFKPNGGDIWFVFINNENNIVVGSMNKEQWDTIVIAERLNFKPRARLLLQLGDQLIRNETIAITELVKNSYDADASYCNVIMNDINNKSKGEIIIEDDGWGMNLDTVKKIWLEPGSDSKEKIVKEKELSPKGRLPIGEKGIGRFGVHKLGREIELVSKKNNFKEVVVKIDWDNFKEHKYLENAPVIAYEQEPKTFTNGKTGTKITLKKLPVQWTRGKLREVFRSINAVSVPTTYNNDKIELIELTNKQLKSPEDNSFRVFGKTNITDWIKDIPKWQDIIQYSLFYFNIEILDDKIKKFEYSFKPWANMKQIKGRTIQTDDLPVSGLLDIDAGNKRKFEPIDIPDNIKIGLIKFEGCIFVRDKGILKIGLDKPTFLTDYLNENGGLRIYRDGLRVYDYGEKGNDWLSLDYRRFNDPGVKISNNLILASITLERENSSSLIEKTNREGFIENEAYEIFKSQIKYALRLVELCREPDKRRLDEAFKPKKETESVLKSIYNLRGFVDDKITDDKTNKELKQYIDRVEVNYKFMYDKLVKTASAGMGWSIYLHEIEKIIKEIEKVIQSNNEDNRAVKLVNHLSKLIESYSQILRKSDRTTENLKTIIDQSLFNVNFRFKAHKIEVIKEYNNYPNDSKIKLSRNLIVSTLMNIYDNSIYWLDRAGSANKKIRIAISDEKEGYKSIVISDNGTGFLLSPEEMIEPLFSAREGMGMGLHLANEIMTAHNDSLLSFNEYEEFEIPEEFKEGATLALCFKI